MSFRKSIPYEVLSNPTTDRFVTLLDALQQVKQEVIAKAIRASNPVLCNDRKWLLKYLADFGLMGVPEFLPVVCLQQLALNLDVIFRLRGTLEGLEVLCNSVGLGTTEIDTGDFDKAFVFLLPNSIYEGMITNNSDEDTHRFLVDRSPLNESCSLGVNISSKAFASMTEEEKRTLVRWLTEQILSYVSFHPNCTINITLDTLDEYVYPRDFNEYFKN